MTTAGPAADRTPAFELRDVRRRFGAVEVLAGISLTADPGQVVAVYGRSGSGKTTLLNLIGGLDQPDGGQIRLLGQDLGPLPPAARDELRRRKVGFIFQSYGLLSHLTARENVEFGVRLAGGGERGATAGDAGTPARADRVDWALDAVGLAGRAHHRPAELSGGERQRVALARALAARPRLILADEPTGALDHATGRQIIDLLVAFAREADAAICIATHDISIQQRVDAAYRITAGQLALQGG